jgi:hypothetical protein
MHVPLSLLVLEVSLIITKSLEGLPPRVAGSSLGEVIAGLCEPGVGVGEDKTLLESSCFCSSVNTRNVNS